jgi:hypothetical protein
MMETADVVAVAMSSPWLDITDTRKSQFYQSSRSAWRRRVPARRVPLPAPPDRKGLIRLLVEQNAAVSFKPANCGQRWKTATSRPPAPAPKFCRMAHCGKLSRHLS